MKRGLENPVIRERKIGLDALWSVENFGGGRGDRPTAAMVKNHGGAPMKHQFPSRSATVALNRWLEVWLYVCLRTKQASLL
jgi:hypothetical protein